MTEKRYSSSGRSAEAEQYRSLYKRAAWRRLRRAKLQEKPLCERHHAVGQIVPAQVVNHKKAHKGDLGLFYSWDNLESVCKECHDSVIQAEEWKEDRAARLAALRSGLDRKRGYSNEIGPDGFPADPKHPRNQR